MFFRKRPFINLKSGADNARKIVAGATHVAERRIGEETTQDLELAVPGTVDHVTAESNINFCPEGNTARSISRRGFPPEKKQAIRQLHTFNKSWNFVILLHYVIWLSAGTSAVLSHNLILDIVLYFVAGLSLSTLSVLGHEASHNLFTRNANIDRWLGFLCGLPVLFSAAGYRIMHPSHHKFLHTKDDPDDIENVSTSPALLRIVSMFIFLGGVYLYLITVPLNAIRKATQRERFGVIVEWSVMLAVASAAWIVLLPRMLLKGWLYPLLFAGQFANLRGITEHGMTTGGNEFTDTRTVATNPILSFMMCNINRTHPSAPLSLRTGPHTRGGVLFLAAGSFSPLCVPECVEGRGDGRPACRQAGVCAYFFATPGM